MQNIFDEYEYLFNLDNDYSSDLPMSPQDLSLSLVPNSALLRNDETKDNKLIKAFNNNNIILSDSQINDSMNSNDQNSSFLNLDQFYQFTYNNRSFSLLTTSSNFSPNLLFQSSSLPVQVVAIPILLYVQDLFRLQADIDQQKIFSNSMPLSILTLSKLNSNKMLEILTIFSKNFPLTLKHFISNILRLPQCPKPLKISISNRKIIRMTIKELSKFILNHLNELYQIMTEDRIVFLFLKVYEDYFSNILNQKKYKAEQFIK
jgi:hypothetical protein